MKRFIKNYWPEIMLLICIAALLFSMCGCKPFTRDEQVAATTAASGAGAVIAPLFGLPPMVGQSIGAALIAVISAILGHKNGRRKERLSKAAA